MPELVQEVQPGVISFVVTDLRAGRLAGLGREAFEGLLKAAGIPAKYYCRCSFTTWDVLLPSEELAVGLAGSSITSECGRNFWDNEELESLCAVSQCKLVAGYWRRS